MVVLSTLRQGWQQQPSANTKRGKPHRATLKARLWDEPPQLARSLATGFYPQKLEVTNLPAAKQPRFTRTLR